MKRDLSIKQLTLLAGVVVALIVVILLASTTSSFSLSANEVAIPKFGIPTVAKTVADKILLLF